MIKILLETSECMNNNFLYFRNKANVSKKTLAKLLNTSVYTYCGYETNRLTVPNEVIIMFSKILGITIEEIFLDPALISEETKTNIEQLNKLKEPEQECELIRRLTGKDCENISYKEIGEIKKDIYNKLKRDGVPH